MGRNGRLLLHCFSGCRYPNILHVLDRGSS
jgi:hypothetical protein